MVRSLQRWQAQINREKHRWITIGPLAKSQMFPTSSDDATGASWRRFWRGKCIASVDFVCNCVYTATLRVFSWRSSHFVAFVSRFPRAAASSPLLFVSSCGGASLSCVSWKLHTSRPARCEKRPLASGSPFYNPCCRLIAASTRSQSRWAARWLIIASNHRRE